ncbi:MAG: DUF1294 domain-containing protein [Solirubrobacterales bacterium]
MFKYFLLYFAVINLFGFFEMYHDKRKSIKKQWRTKEARFFIIAVVFGGPGVLLGMYTFHHKTKHIKFTFGIPLIIIFQIGLWYYFIRS